jgi:phospholipid/cholesterol/gamma-HCH transport system substrate-binding protein
MAAVALVILAVLVILLTGNKNIFAREVTIYAYLNDSVAITEGSAVRLQGIAIGKISRVALSGLNTPNRKVRLDLVVEERRLAMIPSDSTATVGAENLLGTKYINIKMGASSMPIRPGGELKSLDPREFQDLVDAAYPSLESMQRTVERVERIVQAIESGQGSIGKLLVDDELYRRLVHTVAEVEKVAAAIASGKGTVGKLLYDEALYGDFRGTMKRVDTVIADLQKDLQTGKGTIGKLLKDPALHDEIKTTVAEIRATIAEINKGQGTAGKLIKSDELHANLNRLVTNLDKTIDRLNAGQGTMGQLLVNPSLYDSMNGTMREVNQLMKDFRANPKKFLTIQLKLF